MALAAVSAWFKQNPSVKITQQHVDAAREADVQLYIEHTDGKPHEIELIAGKMPEEVANGVAWNNAKGGKRAQIWYRGDSGKPHSCCYVCAACVFPCFSPLICWAVVIALAAPTFCWVAEWH